MTGERYRMSAEEHDAMKRALLDSVTIRKRLNRPPRNEPHRGDGITEVWRND